MHDKTEGAGSKGLPRRYTFKLYPNKEQEEEMVRQCHMVGTLWNALLERCETNYRLWREGRRADASDWPGAAPSPDPGTKDPETC